MSYESCEAALQTLLQTLSGFSGTGVSLDDQNTTNKGKTKYINLRYGGFEARPETNSSLATIAWIIEIHLFTQHQTASQVRNLQRDSRQAILNAILAHPRLNGTAFDAFPVRGRRGSEDVIIGQPRFFEEIIDCVVTEAIDTPAVD